MTDEQLNKLQSTMMWLYYGQILQGIMIIIGMMGVTVAIRGLHP